MTCENVEHSGVKIPIMWNHKDISANEKLWYFEEAKKQESTLVAEPQAEPAAVKPKAVAAKPKAAPAPAAAKPKATTKAAAPAQPPSKKRRMR